MPLVTVERIGSRRVIAAADALALQAGLAPGLPVAQAQARLPRLMTVEADPAADRHALHALARWCTHLTPHVALDDSGTRPHGLWLDVTGCAHLHAVHPDDSLEAGETALLAGLLRRLTRAGIAARAAIADTPGAAHALARHGRRRLCVVPPGAQGSALAPLPVAALRLDSDSLALLGTLGLHRIGQLLDLPRAPLERRFGRHRAGRLLLRMDQATGQAPEPIAPLPYRQPVAARLAFVEPLLTPEALSVAFHRLTHDLCARLHPTGQGARLVHLSLQRCDSTRQALEIGLAAPSQDERHIARLLKERLGTIEPGEGIETMRLVVRRQERMTAHQDEMRTEAAPTRTDSTRLARLLDLLASRTGLHALWRPAPVESDVPERSVMRIAPLFASPLSWPAHLPRPVRLLDPPHPVRAMAALPDAPPVFFVWRHHRHVVRRADGPERIAGEWWRRDGERHAVRDYFRVEDEEGGRYWLFRRGDGTDTRSGDLSWFLHGLF